MKGDSPGSMRVVEVRSAEELRPHVAAIDELAAAAIEPNVFYEPWVLFSAIDAFGKGHDLRFVLVFGTSGDGRSQLYAFFPFERGRRFGGMPITVFRAWKYGTAYCGMCTPLLRAQGGEAVLAALHAWARDSADGPAIFEWQRFNGDGPFGSLLSAFLARSGRPGLQLESHSRPLLCRHADAEEFMRLGYSARHLATNRRKERRLAEQGTLQYHELMAGDDAGAWAREFIQLEAAGWKAGEAGIIAASDASRRFFLSVIEEGWRRGRLMILALRLDGVLIGGMCNLLAAPGSYLYKVAFDERFSRYSPGELVQQENIRRMHARPDIHWMDSLAEPSFEHVYRWLDLRTIRSVVCATGRRGGDLALSLLPAVKWLKGRLHGK
jgi:hypothetical protein